MDNLELTNVEMRIMDVIWESDIPLSVEDIHNKVSDLTVGYISNQIKNLTNKEMIHIADFRLPETRGKHIRLFQPSMTAQEYIEVRLNQELTKYKIPLPKFASQLISNNLEDDFLEELKKQIDATQEDA